MKGMQENQILVLIKEPGKPPVVEPLFDNTLESFQKAVGGYIETYYLAPGVTVICNEEGKLRELPYNVTIGLEHFVGTIVFCGTTKDAFCSLKAAQIPLLKALVEDAALHRPKVTVPEGGSHG